LGFQDRQRFPDRGATDVELRGELDLAWQRGALLPGAGHDQIRDFARHMVAGLAHFGRFGQCWSLTPTIILSDLLWWYLDCNPKYLSIGRYLTFDSRFYVGHILQNKGGCRDQDPIDQHG